MFKPTSGTEPLIQRRTLVSNPLACLLSTIFSVSMFLLKLSVAVLGKSGKSLVTHPQWLSFTHLLH